MAEIAGNSWDLGNGAKLVVWEGLAAADTLAPVDVSGYSVVSAQADGDGAVVMSASIGGVVFAPLAEDPNDDVVQLPPSRFYSGTITGGTDTDVWLYAVSTR
jgi:hypothetical protein